MKIKVKDMSKRDNTELIEMIKNFVPFTRKRLGYKQPFSVNLVSDAQNAEDSFGKTAHYVPADHAITLFVDNRHNKDILRSLSHEIVHHHQNCAGRFPKGGQTDEGYAQNDQDLRKLEAEAYLHGNGLMFRDYEDSLKENTQMNKKTIVHILTEAVKRVKSKGGDSNNAEKLAMLFSKELLSEQPELQDEIASIFATRPGQLDLSAGMYIFKENKEISKETIAYVLNEAAKRVNKRLDTQNKAKTEQILAEAVESDVIQSVVDQDTAAARLLKERSEYRFRVLMERLGRE